MATDNTLPARKTGNADYDLATLLDMTKSDTMFAINCHAVGTIQSFDSDKQTAEVSINYKRVIYGKAGDPPTLADYPILVDVPVIVLSGGLGALTFPIAQGDTCLLLFNDRDLDNWFSSGQVVGPATPRMHSFSDAIALVGVHSLKSPIDDYDADKVVLKLDQTKLTLGAKVHLENATTDLLTVLKGLIDAIKAIQTIPAVVGTPLTLGAASIAALESYKTTIEGLLE